MTLQLQKSLELTANNAFKKYSDETLPDVVGNYNKHNIIYQRDKTYAVRYHNKDNDKKIIDLEFLQHAIAMRSISLVGEYNDENIDRLFWFKTDEALQNAIEKGFEDSLPKSW